MFCPTCGANLEDGTNFCPVCGTQIQAAAQPSYTAPETQILTSEESPFQNQSYPSQEAPAPQQPLWSKSAEQVHGGSASYQLPMAWHKFLVNFSLWASMVLNLGGASNYITGMVYEYNGAVTADVVYAYYPAMKVLDPIMGILLIAIAVFCVVTRFRLARFKTDGPFMLYALMISNFAVSFLYLLIGSALTGLVLFNVSSCTSLVASLGMFFINRAYYTKRKHLFVN